MLLSHGWLAPLSKPATITEDDEEEVEISAGAISKLELGESGTEDKEVAAWVKHAIERKRSGLMGESQKPALHAAPLDSVNPAASLG